MGTVCSGNDNPGLTPGTRLSKELSLAERALAEQALDQVASMSPRASEASSWFYIDTPGSSQFMVGYICISILHTF